MGSKCLAYQASDQMLCECGLQWDMNDPEPPVCNARQVEEFNKHPLDRDPKHSLAARIGRMSRELDQAGIDRDNLAYIVTNGEKMNLRLERDLASPGVGFWNDELKSAIGLKIAVVDD